MSKVDNVAEEYNRRWTESEERHRNQYIPEKYQLGIIADYLRSEGIVYTTEARVFSYPIDLLCVDGEDTIAIEMKSKDVSRGIEQAQRDADVVDYSYLALWEHRISTELVDEIDKLSIGLMSIDEGVEILSEASSVAQQLCRKENIVEQVLADVRDNCPVQERE